MAAIVGYTGSVTFGGGAVVIVKKWDITDQASTEDVTAMASGFAGRKSFATTLTEWSGSFSGFIDSTDAKFKGTTPAISAGAAGAASFVAGALGTYSGAIIITSCKTSVPVEGIIAYDVAFQGNGSLTYPSA